MARNVDLAPARATIIEQMRRQPITSVRELVALTGVSRQRVHQILRKEGLDVPTERELRAARGIVVRPVSRMPIEGPTVHITASAAGTISELMVAADLTTRGWTVFFPLVRTAKCDLLVLSADGTQTRRIEVRSGKRFRTSLAYNAKPTDTRDHYAIVLSGEPVIFNPPLPPIAAPTNTRIKPMERKARARRVNSG